VVAALDVAEAVAVAEAELAIELMSSVTPALAHNPCAACKAVCKSLPVHAPSTHDVVVEMNCELLQRQASSVEEQLPKVVVVVAVRHGIAQVGKLESCLRKRESIEAETQVDVTAAKSRSETRISEREDWYFASLRKSVGWLLV